MADYRVINTRDTAGDNTPDRVEHNGRTYHLEIERIDRTMIDCRGMMYIIRTTVCGHTYAAKDMSDVYRFLTHLDERNSPVFKARVTLRHIDDEDAAGIERFVDNHFARLLREAFATPPNEIIVNDA